MGNTVMLSVLSAPTADVGTDPTLPPGTVDPGAVAGEWTVEWLLPFLWMGLVPDRWWAELGERLLRAHESGAAVDTEEIADVVVAWPIAEQAYRSRIAAVESAWPEFADPAARFVDDVASVASRIAHPVVRLQLDQLVTMSADDETELGRLVTDLLVDADQWSHPDRLSDGRVSDVHRAAAAAEPHRSFLLAGEWTAGGSPAPRTAPPDLPTPTGSGALSAPRTAPPDPSTPAGPRVPRPAYLSEARWAARYGIHGEDLWQEAEIAAAQKARRAGERPVYPWYWVVIIAIVYAVVAWIILGMVTDSVLVASVGGLVVGAAIVVGWRVRRRGQGRSRP